MEAVPVHTPRFETQFRTWHLVAVVITIAVEKGDASTGGDTNPLSAAEFVDRADRIRLGASRHFDELPDPVGGAKPVGLGTFMRAWTAKLRGPKPRRRLAHGWEAGLDLLDRAADKLDDAEAGDPDAPGEALWNLEARAQNDFDAMHMPFRVCFVE